LSFCEVVMREALSVDTALPTPPREVIILTDISPR